MPDYKNLYHKMFNAVTETIEYLQKIQIEAEEKYLKDCEDEDKRRENTDLRIKNEM